ncbi:MAG: hypothetical protein IJS37_02630 [Bacilli bacterium]|nr:hypothetical protein [Bacilli bacterium]
MATLLLAAAGSVGGTVAWFSATTTFSTNISTFKVVRLDGDLSCAMVAGTGTTLTGETISVTEGAELTHGSFNHTNGKVYVQTSAGNFAEKASVAANGGAVSGTIEAGRYTDTAGSHTVYYAITWQMNFTYTLPVSASAGTAMNLYLDMAGSSMTPTVPTGTYTLNTNKGFRIAFYPNTDTNVTTSTNVENTRVWADKQESTGCTYVSGAGATTPASYAAPTLIDMNNTTVITDGNTGSATADICLGGFRNYTSGSSKLGFTCVAWFEGTDANVVNAASLDTVATSLAFYTRTNG